MLHVRTRIENGLSCLYLLREQFLSHFDKILVKLRIDTQNDRFKHLNKTTQNLIARLPKTDKFCVPYINCKGHRH